MNLKTTLLTLAGLLVIAASSCETTEPNLPECREGTQPYVCHQIGLAECGVGLDAVAGCYVKVSDDVRLTCVSSCAGN